jgi:cob(I)alamin adenosyltransferase
MTEMSDETSDVPTDDPRPEGLRVAPSLVLVNTGDGKGKSSAAFGVVMRALAREWRVAVVQFLKSGGWNTGEEKIGRQLGVDWFAIGEGFTWDSKDLTQDEAVAQEAWRQAKELIRSDDYRLVVLDEITYPMNWGWISTDDVIATIRDRPAKVNVVATGRDAPAALIELADTVTEMRSIKHAYERPRRAVGGLLVGRGHVRCHCAGRRRR